MKNYPELDKFIKDSRIRISRVEHDLNKYKIEHLNHSIAMEYELQRDIKNFYLDEAKRQEEAKYGTFKSREIRKKKSGNPFLIYFIWLIWVLFGLPFLFTVPYLGIGLALANIALTAYIIAKPYITVMKEDEWNIEKQQEILELRKAADEVQSQMDVLKSSFTYEGVKAEKKLYDDAVEKEEEEKIEREMEMRRIRCETEFGGNYSAMLEYDQREREMRWEREQAAREERRHNEEMERITRDQARKEEEFNKQRRQAEDAERRRKETARHKYQSAKARQRQHEIGGDKVLADTYRNEAERYLADIL